MAAEFRINVVVDPSSAQRGTRSVEQGFRRLETSADRVRRSIRNVFAGIGLSLIIRETIQLADAYTNIQNRLRTVTQGTAQLAAVTEELFRVSRDTRSSFQSTAELYTRVSLATRELGLTQRQTIGFTESLNQAILLSGSTAREAEGGLIQLSQGLASGALRGDELRSVLESFPVVADVIAQELGVTRGELRGLGADGLITADVITRAFINAEGELSERFAVLGPTIGQAFQVLQNSVIGFVGDINESTGIADALARSLLFVADNLEDIARAALIAGVGLLTAFSPQLVAQINAITAAVGRLTIALARNPIGLLAVALSTIVSALVLFRNEISLSTDRLGTLGDLFTVVFGRIEKAIEPAVEIARDLFGPIVDDIGDVVSAIRDFDLTIESVLLAAADGVDTLIKVWNGLNAAVTSLSTNIAEAGSGAFESFTINARAAATVTGIVFDGIANSVRAGVVSATAALEPFTTFVSEVFDNIADAAQSVVDAIQGVFDRFVSLARLAGIDISLPGTEFVAEAFRIGTEVGTAFTEGLSTPVTAARDLVAGVLDEAEQIAENRRDAAAGTDTVDLNAPRKRTAAPRNRAQLELLEDINRELEQERILLGLTNSERAIQERIFDLEADLRRENLTLSREERTELENQIRTLQELEDSPIRQFLTDVESLTVLVEQGLVDVLEGVSNTFADLAVTGRLSFESLGSAIQDVARQLANAAIQAAIVRPLLASFGFADGGVLSNGNVQAFAQGGIVGGPTLFPTRTGIGLMGEAGPEAIMPLARTSSGRLGVEVAGGSARGSTNVFAPSISVSVQSSGNAGQAQQDGQVAARAVRREVESAYIEFTRNAQRPGGSLNASRRVDG